MIILSQNTLMAIRRSVIVSNNPIEDEPGRLVWNRAEEVLVANEELTAAIAVYLEEGRSWDAVKAAKANLARAVHEFEIQEDGSRIRRRLDMVGNPARRVTFTVKVDLPTGRSQEYTSTVQAQMTGTWLDNAVEYVLRDSKARITDILRDSQ